MSNLPELADRHHSETGHTVKQFGVKTSSYAGEARFECVDCDWKTEPYMIGDYVKQQVEGRTI